jgi:hypothetical protein
MDIEVESYVRDARRVLEAGAALAEALEQAQPEDIEDAVEGLKSTSGGGPAASRRGFSSTKPEYGPPPLALESALVLAELDVSIAQLYVAASQAVGETASAAPPESFRRAVASTGRTLDDLQSAAGKLGFAEKILRISSANPKEATDTFRQEGNVVAETILDHTEAQVRKGFSAIDKHKDRVVEAFSHLDQLTELATPLVDLLRRAWERLTSALKMLKEIVAAITNEQAVEYLTDLLSDTGLRESLKGILGDAAVRKQLKSMRFRSSLQQEPIDRKAEELEVLGERFARVAKRAMAVAAMSAVVAPFFAAHIASPIAAPFATPAAYALGMLAVLVIARDYLHAGHFNSGHGICAFIAQLTEPQTGR